MSLILCEECGKEISDMARVCPHCGYPVSASCVIHIMWDNMKGNTYLKTGLYVDGSFIKEMKCSEILDYNVKLGAHRIDLFFRNKCVVSKTINISSRQTDEYIAFRQTLTGLKLVDPSLVKWCKENRTHHIPKCPTCGSTNIKRISSFRRSASSGIYGIASRSALKTFECRNCKYTW